RIGRRRVGHGVGEVGADVEELVLHPGEQLEDVRGEATERYRRADRTVRLLDIRIGGEARVGLGGAAAVGERGAAVVAGAGVNAREHDRVFAAVTRHEPTLRGSGE